MLENLNSIEQKYDLYWIRIFFKNKIGTSYLLKESSYIYTTKKNDKKGVQISHVRKFQIKL